MRPLVSGDDFPAAQTCTYLNTASVNLMYKGAEEATVGWYRDLAERGTISFDEEAEEAVFAGLHSAAARLLGAPNDRDTAVGSSATELLASLAWGLSPGSGRNIVGTDVAFPSTMYPWIRMARDTGAEIRWVRADDTYVDQDELLSLIGVPPSGRTLWLCGQGVGGVTVVVLPFDRG